MIRSPTEAACYLSDRLLAFSEVVMLIPYPTLEDAGQTSFCREAPAIRCWPGKRANRRQYYFYTVCDLISCSYH